MPTGEYKSVAHNRSHKLRTRLYKTYFWNIARNARPQRILKFPMWSKFFLIDFWNLGTVPRTLLSFTILTEHVLETIPLKAWNRNIKLESEQKENQNGPHNREHKSTMWRWTIFPVIFHNYGRPRVEEYCRQPIT